MPYRPCLRYLLHLAKESKKMVPSWLFSGFEFPATFRFRNFFLRIIFKKSPLIPNFFQLDHVLFPDFFSSFSCFIAWCRLEPFLRWIVRIRDLKENKK